MRRWLGNLAALVLSAALCLVAAEAALRLVPNPWSRAQAARVGPPPVRTMRELGAGLYTAEPNSAAEHRGACYHLTGIRFNGDGFRDRDHGTGGDRRLLLLGDSFLDGRHVAEGETVAAQLERLAAVDAKVVAAEGWGTVTELAAFKRFGAAFRAQTVVVFFYLGNDVADNSCRLTSSRARCSLSDAEAGASSAPAGAAGAKAAQKADAQDSALRRRLADRLVLYHALHDMKLLALGVAGGLHGEVPERWSIYLREQPAAWRDAWADTETALARLKQEAAAAGGRLVVVSIPEYIATSPQWRRDVMLSGGSAIPDGFDPAAPSRRLAEIAQRQGVPVVDLLPAFIAYRQSHQLPAPYFSYGCDGHWNPLAHYLAAHELAAFLGLEAGAARDAAFARPPAEILGPAAYDAIYRGGVYRGGSATAAAP